MRPRKKDRNLPPCVYLKHGAYWYVHGGKWQRLADTLPEALARYAIVAAPRDGGMVDLIERAHPQIIRRVKPATAAQYDFCRKVVSEMLAEFQPAQVRSKDIAAIKSCYADRPNMGNRILSYLRLVFSCALEWGEVENNPVIGIKRHAEHKRRRYLSDSELAAIRQCSPDHLRAIVDVAYLTGQRIGDVLAIKLSEVSVAGIYFEQQKTGSRLLISMTPDLQDAIQTARNMPERVHSLFLLTQRKGGKPYTYGGVKKSWNVACAKAGIKDATLHDLRAKSLTDAKKQGLDAVALGGHSDPRMTDRYIRQRETTVAIPPKMAKY